MIHFFVGKPRNGKSLLAMFRIWEILTTSEKYVITNMVIFFDTLQMLLIARGFGHIDARRRIRMLNDDETKDFWLHREFHQVPVPECYHDKTGLDVDYSSIFDDPRYYDKAGENLRGTMYVIDEVHTHWRARGWQGTPRHVEFYNSQHGKLNDTVIFITQNTKLVDQNFPRLAQDFTYCRNHRLEKHGMFRGDNKFTASTYQNPISNQHEVTLNVKTYALDREIAACYDTSAGVGMRGGGNADAGFRAKGIPLKMVWVGLAAILVLVFFTFNFVIPKLTRKYVAPVISPVSSGGSVPAVSGGLVDQAVPSVSASSSSSDNIRSANLGVAGSATKPLMDSYLFPAEDFTPAKTIYVTGWVKRGGRYIVQLSNGDRVGEGEKSIVAISSTRVVFRDGTIMRLPVAGRSAVPVAAADSSSVDVSTVKN